MTLKETLQQLKTSTDVVEITRWCYGMDTSYPAKVARENGMKVSTRCIEGKFYAKLRSDTP